MTTTGPPSTSAARRQQTAAVWMRIFGCLRDLSMIGVGMLGLLGMIPPTVDDLGVTGPAGAVWCSGFILGGLAATLGAWADLDTVHAAGCMAIGVGFAVWALAAVCQPEASAVSWMVALVFLAGTFGQLYRSLAIALGVTRIVNTAAGLPVSGTPGGDQ